jgi:hypothetical protein
MPADLVHGAPLGATVRSHQMRRRENGHFEQARVVTSRARAAPLESCSHSSNNRDSNKAAEVADVENIRLRTPKWALSASFGGLLASTASAMAEGQLSVLILFQTLSLITAGILFGMPVPVTAR